jgi:glycerophosphoryl diester phosphodiesterase
MIGSADAPTRSRLQIIAHRGDSARRRRNSVSGAWAALDTGAGLVEADVRFSAGGELFCIHEPTLARPAGVADLVADCPAARLTGGPTASGGIVSLREILGVVVRSERRLVVDVKIPGMSVMAGAHGPLGAAGWPDEVWFGVQAPDQAEKIPTVLGAQARVLALPADIADAGSFVRARADAVRVWESAIAQPMAHDRTALMPIWVTADGAGRTRVSDADADGMAGIRTAGTAGTILNDPTLACRSAGESW